MQSNKKGKISCCFLSDSYTKLNFSWKWYKSISRSYKPNMNTYNIMYQMHFKLDFVFYRGHVICHGPQYKPSSYQISPEAQLFPDWLEDVTWLIWLDTHMTIGAFDFKRRCAEWSVYDNKVPRERQESWWILCFRMALAVLWCNTLTILRSAV